MPDIGDFIQLIGQAKAYIDNGLCRVGQKLKPVRVSEAFLTGGASRSLALADSVVQLCRHDHPTEALPVLRQLAETVVAMRWSVAPIAKKESKLSPDEAAEECNRRAKKVFQDCEAADWEKLWPAERLAARARDAGFPQRDVDGVLGGAVDFALGNSTVAPWSHIFEQNQRSGVEAQAVLGLAVRLMGHCIRALDEKWPGDFPGSEAMWEDS